MSSRPEQCGARAPFGRRATLACTTALVVAGLAFAASASAQPAPAPAAGPVPFATFVDGLKTARATDFLGRPGVALPHEAAFEEIRAHLLKIYDGQDVKLSLLQDGQTFDCIPLAEQPAKRLQGVTKFAAPPPFSPQVAFGKTETDSDRVAMKLAHANKLRCPMGSFAMPRMTLEQISQFGSLQAYFQKGPNGAGQVHDPRHERLTPNSGGHAYAYAYQYVNNIGGQSSLSLNDPYVNTSLGEVFSLMQQWYVGFGSAGVQTAEDGWQNYPARLGDERSHLFAYWTADGYSTTGCYDYTCGAFVAYGGAPISLGQYWNAYAVPGGPQYYITIGYYLWQGNWWYAYGTGWVGYYPGSIYRGGPLATGASLFELGTESVGTAGWWPPEGSGDWAATGYPYAGFQLAIQYRTSNGLNPVSLTSTQPSPSCYSITNEAYGGSFWQDYVYLGGPGGTGC